MLRTSIPPDSMATSNTQSPPRAFLWVAFATSGAVALALEVVWVRLLSQVFGSTNLAIATTLAAFMGGLAAGAGLASRFGGRTRRPLLWWAGAELTVALCAVLLPPALHALAPYNALAWRALNDSPLLLGGIRFGASALLLVPPAMAMGVSLPLLARALGDGKQAAKEAAWLYAVNTFGGMVGAGAAGLWLLPALGIQGLSWLAAAGAVSVAAAGWWASRPAQPQQPFVGPAPVWAWTALLAVFATGFSSMALEVLASRAYGLVLGSGTASFTGVLLVFLFGLSAGAATLGRSIAGAEGSPRAALALLVAGSGLGIALLVAWMHHLPAVAFLAMQTLGASYDSLPADLVRFGVIGLLLPATACLGASWAAALRLSDDPNVARGVGRIVVANTLGNIFGSLVAGFVWLPRFGVEGSLRGLGAGLGVSAVVIAATAAASSRRNLAFAAALASMIASVAAPPWDTRQLAFGLYRLALPQRRDRVLEGEVLFHRDGISSTVTVAQHVRGNSKNLTLYTNGKPDATSLLDADTQVLLGLTPLFVHGGTKQRVLVIGYGSGMTVGALAASDQVAHIDVVELESTVYDAADAWFGGYNGRPEADPRVKRWVGDGRNLLLSSNETWDIIVSEPPNPWVAGVADLFTQDFYAVAKTRLAPGGLFAQWVQIYELHPDTVRSIWATFASVFPDLHAFRTSGNDALLIGGLAPWRVDESRMLALADDPDVRAMLQIAGARDPWEVLTRYAFGPADVGELSEGGRIITDDGAWLDHVAWRDLLTAVHDPTASAWQQEIGLAIGDRGQLSALLRPQGPGPARGRTALGLATALVHARRWDQAARWTGVAKAEGMPTDALDAAFRARGKVLIQPAPRL